MAAINLILGLSFAATADAITISLRSRTLSVNVTAGSFNATGGGSSSSVVKATGDKSLHVAPLIELVSKESIQMTETADCLCPLGKFWHWRIHRCIDQGAWGYECGFFPGEHHHRVCRDGLRCAPVQGADDTYVWHGQFQGTAGSFPAACDHCAWPNEAECQVVGLARHNADCLKQIDVAGKACATVRVTAPGLSATVTTKSTQTATKDAEATATAEATESASAESKKTATAEKDGATAKATATGKGEATATATAEATATGKGKATGSGEATVTKVADGVAETTACVEIPEVKEELGLENVPKIGRVLAQEIISEGDRIAFERASKYALEAAKENGILSATGAAEQAANALSAMKAQQEAERLADEAAAWEAEAGAHAGAKKAASARAKAMAEEQAKLKADAAAAKKAEAAAANKAAAAAQAKADKLAAKAAAGDAAAAAEAKQAQAEANAAQERASAADTEASAAAAEADRAQRESKMTKLAPMNEREQPAAPVRKVPADYQRSQLPF